MKVNKTVPLRTTLRVELDLVIVSMASQWAVNEADDLVNESFTAKSRSLYSSNGPVQGDGDTISCLFVCFLDDILSQQVQCSVDILLAILIPNAPSTALGHVLDIWKVFEVGELRHVDRLFFL